MAFDFNEQFEKMMREYDVTEVVLLGHMNPDGDAAGSVMGLALIADRLTARYN